MIAADRVVADRELLRLQPVVADHLRHQVPLGDLDLLVLGVAGDADDLHAVHQRRGMFSVFAVVTNITFERS